MCMMPVLIVASVLGVKWGWEPVAGGGVEYIIRIEPHAIEALRSGRDIFSDLPPQIQRVRSYRITVSDKPVPHEGELPPADLTDRLAPAQPAQRCCFSNAAAAILRRSPRNRCSCPSSPVSAARWRC